MAIQFPKNDQDKWLFYYSLPCTGGHLAEFKKIREKLPNLTNREKVLEHFLGNHNITTKEKSPDGKNWMHLALPYLCEDYDDSGRLRFKAYSSLSWLPNSLATRAFEAFHLDISRNYGIISEVPRAGDIVVVHGLFIVDQTVEQEVKARP